MPKVGDLVEVQLEDLNVGQTYIFRWPNDRILRGEYVGPHPMGFPDIVSFDNAYDYDSGEFLNDGGLVIGLGPFYYYFPDDVDVRGGRTRKNKGKKRSNKRKRSTKKKKTMRRRR